MRLTLTSKDAQTLLAAMNDALPRGKKQAPSYSILVGVSMAQARVDATTKDVAELFTGLEDFLFTSIPSEFPVTLDVTLHANDPATRAVAEAAQKQITEFQATIAAQQQQVQK